MGASISKFIQQAGGRLHGGSGGGWRIHSSASSLWPRAALSARPPLFVPTAERAAPMSPLERNEKKERIAAVTWALFHSPRSPWQRGRDPGSTRPLFLDSVLKAGRQLEVSPHDRWLLFHGPKYHKYSTLNARNVDYIYVWNMWYLDSKSYIIDRINVATIN